MHLTVAARRCGQGPEDTPLSDVSARRSHKCRDLRASPTTTTDRDPPRFIRSLGGRPSLWAGDHHPSAGLPPKRRRLVLETPGAEASGSTGIRGGGGPDSESAFATRFAGVFIPALSAGFFRNARLRIGDKQLPGTTQRRQGSRNRTVSVPLWLRYNCTVDRTYIQHTQSLFAEIIKFSKDARRRNM